jgi:protocatechuate 3,4-dioxygenase alpha subunit
MTQRGRLVASASQTIGPFFHVGPGATERHGRMARADASGEHIRLHLRVLDGDGAPVPDAMIELRQADADGVYSSAPSPPIDPAPVFTGFGRLPTDDDGRCTFETIRPGPVRDELGATHAPHVNICIFMRGLMRHSYTRLYFAGDPVLDRDPVLSVVPADRRATLIAQPRAGAPEDSHQAAPAAADWELVIRLQGDGETVFFDI